MKLKLHGQAQWQSVVAWLNRWVTEDGETTELPYDAFYAEVHQIEKRLATAPTRPSRIVRREARMLEPITEQQKFMDMSG